MISRFRGVLEVAESLKGASSLHELADAAHKRLTEAEAAKTVVEQGTAKHEAEISQLESALAEAARDRVKAVLAQL